jgi:hypothetical protein
MGLDDCSDGWPGLSLSEIGPLLVFCHLPSPLLFKKVFIDFFETVYIVKLEKEIF